MLFNNPNFQQSEQQSTETNQRQSVQDIIEKYSHRSSEQQFQASPERGTFGNYKIQSKREDPSNLHFEEANISKILSDFSIVSEEPQVAVGITQLKDRVINIMQQYRQNIEQSKQVDERHIQDEVSQIALEYSMYSQMGKSKNGPELQSICNFVEEFVAKFQRCKSLELSIVNTIPLDDSFYQKPQIENESLHKKLKALQHQLQKALSQLELNYTKQILGGMIGSLDEILTANDEPTIKTVIYKIEEKIKGIQPTEQALLELYDYITKAVRVSRNKLTEKDRYEISRIFEHMRMKNKDFSYDQAMQMHKVFKGQQKGLEEFLRAY